MDIILLSVALTIIKILGHFNLDSLGPQGNHLVDISARNAALKGTNSRQTSVMVQKDIPPNDKLDRLSRDTQLAPEKERQYWNSSYCSFGKKKKLWFGPNNKSIFLKL